MMLRKTKNARASKKVGGTRERVLVAALPMFANLGYGDVSVRAIARTVGINSATLYHHFENKNKLYEAVLVHAYAHKARRLAALVAEPGDKEQRLRKVVLQFCRDLAEDLDFVKLVKREQLEGNPQRLQLLTDLIFGDELLALIALLSEFKPDLDLHLLLTSMLAMMLHHFEISHYRRYMPLNEPKHDDPDRVADHVSTILLRALARA